LEFKVDPNSDSIHFEIMRKSTDLSNNIKTLKIKEKNELLNL